tara:strand:- start:2568 stop:3251 length:684 start_codon:yes stop_codon:yes gene_type:complete
MPRILSIDSSVPNGSVALLDQNRILSSSYLSQNTNSSRSLLASIDQLFAKNLEELKTVDAFAVTNGPGSFTGLRVGVSLVKGLVLATGKSFVAVNTLEALGHLAEPCEHQICPVLDARKKQVYAAFFKFEGNRLNRLSPDMALSPEDLADKIDRPTLFIGQGIDTYEALWKNQLGKFFLTKGIRDESTSVAAGRIALDRLEEKIKQDLNQLCINYIRKSEAEIYFGS